MIEMRYIFFPFIFLIMLIFLSLCSGCALNAQQYNALHQHNLERGNMDIENIAKEKCDLEKQKTQLLQQKRRF